MRGHKMLVHLVLETAKVALAPEQVEKVVNQQDAHGRTALMHAVKASQEDCVVKLLQYGADANLISSCMPEDERTMPPMTALAMVTSTCSQLAPPFLIPLLEHTERLDVVDDWGDTFFLWACRWGHTKAVQRAIACKQASDLGIHVYEEGKQTGLELAIIGRHREIAFAILSTWDRTVSYPDAKRESQYVGIHILRHALDNDWKDVAQLIVEVMPDSAFDRNNEEVQRAVYVCIEKRWCGCLKALVDRGVDAALHQPDGSIPIVTACKLNDEESLGILIYGGAKDIELAITVAVFFDHRGCFELLWERAEHNAELIRAVACMAALTNNIQILRVVLRAEKPEHILHRYGPKVFMTISLCQVYIRIFANVHSAELIYNIQTTKPGSQHHSLLVFAEGAVPDPTASCLGDTGDTHFLFNAYFVIRILFVVCTHRHHSCLSLPSQSPLFLLACLSL
jgi:hypothetical protein